MQTQSWISQAMRGLLQVAVGIWQLTAIVVLLAIVATIPLVQFASLGYMLECGARVSRGLPLRSCFPGARTASKLLLVSLFVFVSWLPVWFIADLAYSTELILPGSDQARRLRLLARGVSFLWVIWILWALFRGGKLRHFVWPAPIYAIRSLFRPAVWREAEDRLWSFATSLRMPYLMWLGFVASVGAVVWLVFPASLIVIGLSAQGGPGLGLVGFIGAMLMIWVLLQLPILQLQVAREKTWLSVFDIQSSRRLFRLAPWSTCLASWGTFLLATPLYLLRIEPPPSQLWWLLSLFFVVLMFPSKLLVGWAIKNADKRQRTSENESFWVWRWTAWVPQLAVVVVYLGVLYVARLALWEGSASIYLQHAFLPPVPFFAL